MFSQSGFLQTFNGFNQAIYFYFYDIKLVFLLFCCFDASKKVLLSSPASLPCINVLPFGAAVTE